MHRLMMTSAAYRQSSATSPELARLDPSNALVSRMPLAPRRGVAYDSLLLVAGRLTRRGGPPTPWWRAATDSSPREHRERLAAAGLRPSGAALPTHLETFDFPQMNPNCLERRDSTVAPQALHLLNNGMVEQLAADFAKRIRREAGNDTGKQVDAVYLIALGRAPTSEEKKLGRASLAKLADEWVTANKLARDAAELKALATYCHAIVNSAAFLYVD